MNKFSYNPKPCPCQMEAIPCDECFEKEAAKFAWMKPLAKANAESIRAGYGPTLAGEYYGDWKSAHYADVYQNGYTLPAWNE